MVRDQVLTIDTFGLMSSLQRKPGEGLDLKEFGRVDIKRTSLVEWNADAQAWEVLFIDGVLAGKRLTNVMQAIAKSLPIPPSGQEVVVHFDTYEQGVDAEIELLDFVRLHPAMGVAMAEHAERC